MRNLKKILALVLALVMSLSLMATASAKQDFTDAASIDEKYATAVEVLNGLEVFKGYQNGSSYDFQPNGEITRAEVAAIIYRIATGDVKDDQVKIYADYNKFTDVPSTLWSAGYINYCANAEYIKGEGNGKFNPEGKVTGYQALAMILRAIGYTANGGFTGPGWDLQTAAVGEARGITKNILKGTLNENASRQTVAEILFQSILVNMVNYDQRTGYYELGETLGYKIFKLESIKGVVVANERANLNGNSVLKEGKTKLDTEDGIRDLDVSSGLDDIGESRWAYVAEKTVLSSLADTGDNTVYDCATDNGKGIKAADAIKKVGRSVEGTTHYFKNFSDVDYYLSDSRIEYELILNLTPDEAKTYLAENGGKSLVQRTYTENGKELPYPAWDWEAGKNIPGEYMYYYNKVIPVGQKITQTDYANIQTIFYFSNGIDWTVDQTTYGNSIGRVYVRTQTNKDISDEIDFKTFETEYLNDTVWNDWGKSENGEWVKIVDYDGNGVVDYAFLTEYHLDRVIGTYTKSDKTYLQYNSLDATSDDYTIVGADSLKVGDTFLYTKIDGRVDPEVIEPLQDSVVTVNYTKDEITLKSGDVKGQSGIDNHTEMQQLIKNMEANVTYDMYLDKYGYVRAYELPGGTEYALVTEVYSTNANVGNLIQSWPLTVELTTADGTKNEYSLSNAANSPLVSSKAWTMIKNRAMINANYYNYLQPAISHLGYPEAPLSGNNVRPVTADLTFWSNSGQRINALSAPLNNNYEFNFGVQSYTNAQTGAAVSQDNGTLSFTNVAVVTKTGDNSVSLSSAAKYRLNENGQNVVRGNTNVFDVDYIQLSTKDVSAGQRQYPIDGSAAYVQNNNRYVNATHDTLYFIAYDGHVYTFSDYANMPALSNAANTIHAAYAVAKNTSADNAQADYWVADVIVYEVKNFNNAKNTSIALGYWNGMKSVASASGIRYLDALDNKAEGTQVTIRPTNSSWTGGQWNDQAQWGFQGMGFYKVYDGSEVVDGEMTASKIDRIPYQYNADGIFAGFIARDSVIDVLGGYIDVNKNNGVTGNQTITHLDVDVATFYSVTDNSAGVTSSDDLVLARGDVNPGDQLIWVMNGDKVAYIVNLGAADSIYKVSRDRAAATPQWLKNIYTDIMNEQVTFTSDETYTITLKTVGLPAGQNMSQTTTAAWNDNVTIDLTSPRYQSLLRRDGYTLASCEKVGGDATIGFTVIGDGTPQNLPTAITLTTVTSDVVIELKYNATAETVKAVTGTNFQNEVTGGATITSAVVSDATGDADLVTNATLTSAYGKAVTLTVTLNQKLAKYENLVVKAVTDDTPAKDVVLTSAGADANGTVYTYTFTMPNANAVEVSANIKALTSNITYVMDGNVVGTDTWTTTTPAVYNVAAQAAAAVPGYTVKGWTAYGADNKTIAVSYDGTGTIALADWTETITIDVTATINKATVNFSAAGYTGTKGTLSAGMTADGVDTANVTNGLTNVTIDNHVFIKAIGAAPVITPAANINVVGMTTLEGTNGYLYEVEIIPAADGDTVTITIA